MEVSKFIIDGNEVNVKDAGGRNLIAGLTDDVTTAQNTADDALNGLALKQDASIAWKIGTVSVTEEDVSIESLGAHTFRVDIPTGASNVIVLNARSSNATRTLIPISLSTSNNQMVAIMSNQSANTMSATMTITFTYAYQ